MITLPEFFLGINAACCVLLGCRCWYLEGRRARLRAAEAPEAPDRKTQVWRGRKPTVFHRRRA